MPYQREREAFLIDATRQGLSRQAAYKLLHYATTLHRLAVAQCNGDWPAANGQWETEACPQCGGHWVPSVLKYAYGCDVKRCPDCRAVVAVKALLNQSPFQPEFNGDPRGAVLRLHPAGTSREDMQSGRSRGLYVPPSSRP